MKKIILNRILLSSVIALPFCAVAASCNADQTAKIEELIKELNDVGTKINLDYPNKQNLFPSNSEHSKVTPTNYSREKYRIYLVSVVPDNATNSIMVNFSVIDRKTGISSMLITKQIEGFGTAKTETEKLDEIAKGIILDYNNKKNVAPKDVMLKEVTATNYDQSIYEVNIQSINFDANNLVFVFFTVTNKNTKLTSRIIRRQIEGFGMVTNIPESENINDIAAKVKLDYPGKENVLTNDARLSAVQHSEYDKTKYSIELKLIKLEPSRRLVSVTYSLKEIKTGITSNEISKQISGFKADVVMNEDLDNVARKVEFSYPNLQNILAEDAELSKFVPSNYDNLLYEVMLKSIERDTSSRLVRVTYSVKNIKTNEVSNNAVKVINGFKQPIYH